MVAHLQHLRDGRDAGDGVFAELADAVGERAQQAVADVDRAAAHAGHYAGVLRLGAVQLGQNHVVAGAARPLRTPRISTCMGSGLLPVKTVQAVPVSPAMDLAQRKEAAARGRSGKAAAGFAQK
jgi:hypothetical protein